MCVLVSFSPSKLWLKVWLIWLPDQIFRKEKSPKEVSAVPLIHHCFYDFKTVYRYQQTVFFSLINILFKCQRIWLKDDLCLPVMKKFKKNLKILHLVMLLVYFFSCPFIYILFHELCHKIVNHLTAVFINIKYAN